jgi:hypothetical protein
MNTSILRGAAQLKTPVSEGDDGHSFEAVARFVAGDERKNRALLYLRRGRLLFGCRDFASRESGRTFLEGVVAFPPVLAGRDRKALLAVADQLSVELGYAEGEELPGAHSALGGGGAMAVILNSEDELLVAGMRHGLAKVATVLGGEDSEGTSGRAVGAALDGAEMVIRGELVRGKAEQLPALMPSFVFLVALTVVDQDRALELSRRTSALLEEALGS